MLVALLLLLHKNVLYLSLRTTSTLLYPTPRPERARAEAKREPLDLGNAHVRTRHRGALHVHPRLGETRYEAADVGKASSIGRCEELVVLRMGRGGEEYADARYACLPSPIAHIDAFDDLRL